MLPFAHLFFPLRKRMTWNAAQCVADADYSQGVLHVSSEPCGMECPYGSRVLQMTMDKFRKLASPLVESQMPDDIRILSIGFYAAD